MVHISPGHMLHMLSPMKACKHGFPVLGGRVWCVACCCWCSADLTAEQPHAVMAVWCVWCLNMLCWVRQVRVAADVLQTFKQSDYMVSEEARTPNVHSRQVCLQHSCISTAAARTIDVPHLSGCGGRLATCVPVLRRAAAYVFLPFLFSQVHMCAGHVCCLLGAFQV
jgi:hypothetical protein